MRCLFLIFLVVLGLASGFGQKKPGAKRAKSWDDLNRVPAAVTMRSGSFPPSTNDLAAFLAIGGKTMPVAPPGKKLVLDPDRRQFIVVDQ